MRAKATGILICCLLLTLTGCLQKSEDAPHAVSTQNVNGAAAPQQSTDFSSANAPPTSATPAAASPTAPVSSPPVTNEEQSSPSNTALRSARPDPCALIKGSEIQKVQGEPIKETKVSDHVSESFTVSQCFYGTPTFSNSISLEITWSNQSKDARRAMREFWDQKFHQDSNAEGEREREAERDREANKPTRIKGLGDEAFWVKSAVGGALYVLKNNAFFRLSIGGKGSDAIKIMKARTLALEVVGRL